MALQTYVSTVVKKQQIANSIWHIVTTKPDGFTYTPGQFVLWQVPDSTNTTIQPRAYSLASHPSEDTIEYVFKYEAGGRASEWVQHKLTIGTEITFQGALGTFCLPTALPNSLVLVATSTGIAPIFAILKELVLQQYAGKVAIVFGVRSQVDIFWQAELEQLVQQLAAATIAITLTKPTITWQGCIGRVQAQLEQYTQELQHSSLFACGNPTMTKEVKAWCMEVAGMPKQAVHIEGFI